ncbi:unnamed protein product [Pylaiella littoralis]
MRRRKQAPKKQSIQNCFDHKRARFAPSDSNQKMPVGDDEEQTVRVQGRRGRQPSWARRKRSGRKGRDVERAGGGG